jgi:predicted nucleic acid-binding protein
MTDQHRSRAIYVDTNAIIYAIEGSDDVAAMLHSLFAVLWHGESLAYTSEFTLAEVLPRANAIQRRSYFTLLQHSGLFNLLPVTREILIGTADYRGNQARQPLLEMKRSMPKLPDAIHIVTALGAGCSKFVSFDRGLRLPEGLDRVGLENGQLLELIENLS